MRAYADIQQVNDTHDELLAQLDERLRTNTTSEQAMHELQTQIKEFVVGLAELGCDLYLDQERSTAHALLNYWCNALTRAGIEHLPASLLPFTEDIEHAPALVDFPFDREGENQRLTWDHYAAGRRFRGQAKKLWDVLPLVAIVGASGSGRDTAANEVIVPAVIEWMTEKDGAPPRVVDLQAERGALDRFLRAIRESGTKVERAARHPLEHLAQMQTPPGRTLLVVHEFRTLLHELDETTWTEWLRALLQWVNDGNSLVLVVNHSHLRLLAEHAEFQNQIIKQQVTTVYDSAELREFIEIPARAARVYFEEGLVERIVRNVQGQQGTLALLDFSLDRLWEVFRSRGGHKLITHADYERVGSGRAAVDRAAEEALATVGGEENTVEKVFLRLVTPTLEAWETHEVSLARLSKEFGTPDRVDTIVQAFVAAKILRLREDAGNGPQVVLRHYALAGCWSRLQSWIESVREKNLPHVLLPRVARRWLREKEPPDLLWRGTLLKTVEQASQKSPAAQRFIAASVRAQRWRRFSSALPIIALLTAIGIWVAWEIDAKKKAEGAAEELRRSQGKLLKAEAQLKTERGERLLETDDPAGALLWFNDPKKPSEPGDWRARRESIALRSLPELFRLATLKAEDGKSAASNQGVGLDATASWMEYSPNGQYGLIAARNLGDKPGGLLLWDLKDPAPRVVAKGGSYERVKFLQPTAIGDLLVATISAPKVGTENGRLELWKWDELVNAQGEAKPLDSAELRAFPVDLAIEERGSVGGPPHNGNMVAIATGQGDASHGSRVLLFEIRKSADGHPKLIVRPDLDKTFEGKTNMPVVNAVQFSRDGRWLLSGAGDVNDEQGEALLFFRDDDRDRFSDQPRRLKHDGPVANVDFCADNTRFVTTTGTQQRGPGEARLWTIGEGNAAFADLKNIPLRHRARVVEARFSPDGQKLVTASQDGAARIWETKTGNFISSLEHEGWLFAARWSPDGRHVLTGSRDGFARLWDATTGLLAWPKLPHTGTVFLTQFAPDGQSVFTATTREFRIWGWHAEQAQPIPTLAHGTVADCAFSPDGRWLATAVKRTDGSELGEVVLTDVIRGEEHARLVVGGPVNKVIFSADGKWLAAGGGRRGGRGGIIRVWQAAQPEETRPPILTKEPVVWLSFQEEAPADRLVALLHPGVSLEPEVHGSSSQVALFRTSDGKLQCPPFDPQTHKSAAEKTEGQPSFGLTKKRDTEETINAIALSPNGRFLAIGGGSLTRRRTFLTVFDLTLAKENTAPPAIAIDKKAHGHLEAITALAFDRKASRLISGSVDDHVRIFNFKKLLNNSDKALWREPIKHNADISSVGFSRDRDVLRAFSCAYDGRVKVIDAVNPVAEPRDLDHPGAVRSASFSDNGMLLATGGDDRKARLWNTQSGDLVGIFPLPWPVATVQLSQDLDGTSGEEYLLTTAFYYPQSLATRAAQRAGPPDTASFGLASRVPMRADTSAVSQRRVDARRWSIVASTSRPEMFSSLAARGFGEDGRMMRQPSSALVSLPGPPSSLPKAGEAQGRGANLSEEQELWTAALWNAERASISNTARLWQEIRVLFGAQEWLRVLAACTSAPAELAQTPEFLRLKAEAQIRLARPGDNAALEESLQTLHEWERRDIGDIMAPLRIAEVLFYLHEYEKADEKLKTLIEREQSKVSSPKNVVETGTLPSLWQRRAEHSWLAMNATSQRDVWIDRYREAALALLANFGSSADNGGVVAWPFALAPRSLWKDHPKVAPNAEEFWTIIENLADKAVEIDPSNFYRLNTLGALLVRGQRFEEAIAWLEESRRSYSQRTAPKDKLETGRALDWCFLALAHAGLATQSAVPPDSPERVHHQKRAQYFADLVVKDQQQRNKPLGAPIGGQQWSVAGGNVWREELSQRELKLLADEVQKIPFITVKGAPTSAGDESR